MAARTARTARIAVLVSGTGSNLQALLDDEVVGRAIGLVVSDRPGAYGLARAEERGVPTEVVEPTARSTRRRYDRALLAALQARDIDVVLLAGFMRIVGPEVVRAFPNRILNVHPALLPAFPGMHAVRQALEHGVRVTGATVHLVEEQVDAGPIVLQEPVIVLPDDDEESLHKRIQEVEHRLYPQAARLLLEGRLRVEGRRVHIAEDAPA
jgi:phosphoribosylglycinamide formyltransferase-1